MRGLVSALRFLTILPVPFKGDWQPRAGLVWFPAVGLLIGALAALPLYFLQGRISPGIAGLLATLIILALSGGLHLDGLADCADGFLSHRPRQEVLAIMKDSRTGAMGVIAIVAALLIKVKGIEAAGVDPWRVVLLMPLAGRVMILLTMALLPYARPEGGIGSLFYSPGLWPRALAGLAFFYLAGWYVAGIAGLAAAGAALAVTLFFSLLSWYIIGGATGDTLGAACEISEAAVAFAFAFF